MQHSRLIAWNLIWILNVCLVFGEVSDNFILFQCNPLYESCNSKLLLYSIYFGRFEALVFSLYYFVLVSKISIFCCSFFFMKDVHTDFKSCSNHADCGQNECCTFELNLFLSSSTNIVCEY